MKELRIPAELDSLNQVFSFIDDILDENQFSDMDKMSVQIAVEEIFANIANYAYHPQKGEAVIRVAVEENPKRVSISFIDGGVPFNPLEKADPDISLDADERSIGGLGIFLVKENMDNISYQYENGNNMLTIVRNCEAT